MTLPIVEYITLANAITAATATSQTSAATIGIPPNGIIWVLDITALSSAAADTLDVTVQGKDPGGNWVDVVGFTQALGNQSALRRYRKTLMDTAQADFGSAATLGSDAQRELFFNEYRVSYSPTSTAGTASFTFSVYAVPI